MRIHDRVNDEANNKIRVVATPVSLTPEEPDTDFLTASPASVVDLGTNGPGTLLLDSFTEPFGDAIQLTVEGIKGNTDDTLEATISVDLVMRD